MLLTPHLTRVHYLLASQPARRNLGGDGLGVTVVVGELDVAAITELGNDSCEYAGVAFEPGVRNSLANNERAGKDRLWKSRIVIGGVGE